MNSCGGSGYRPSQKRGIQDKQGGSAGMIRACTSNKPGSTVGMRCRHECTATCGAMCTREVGSTEGEKSALMPGGENYAAIIDCSLSDTLYTNGTGKEKFKPLLLMYGTLVSMFKRFLE